MDAITPGAIKGAALQIEVGANLQKKVLDSAQQSMNLMLKAMPRTSASMPGVGGNINLSA